MTEPILEATGLVKDYWMGPSRLRVLHGVDLAVARGEFLCVLGPSGSGKSTLLHLLGLLDKPTAGRVRFEGADAFAQPKRWRDRVRNQAVGFVFQFYHLMPDLSVLANTLLPAMIQGPALLWPLRRGSHRRRAREVLGRLGLADRTLVVWTSDNGAPRRNPPQGSNAPLRGWGYTTAEGGMRVPCIAWWPGRIPAGAVCDEVCTTMDLLPTFARLAGTGTPQDRVIDGKDIWPLLSGQPGARSPHEAFFYYCREQLHAVRSGRWKLHLPLKRKMTSFGWDNRPVPIQLYDLDSDIGERVNLAQGQPEVVARLMALAEKAREELGDVGRPGKGQRPAGLVENPTPRVLAPG